MKKILIFSAIVLLTQIPVIKSQLIKFAKRVESSVLSRFGSAQSLKSKSLESQRKISSPIPPAPQGSYARVPKNPATINQDFAQSANKEFRSSSTELHSFRPIGQNIGGHKTNQRRY